MPELVVSFHVATSIPTTLRPTHAHLVYPKPFYMPSFTMLLVSRDFPYGTPIAMMEELQSNASTYVDNNATIVSPLNPYVALGFSISNPGRVTQHGGTAFAPSNVSALTINSMLFIRQ